jgi:DNA-binding NtrC family response regulator
MASNPSFARRTTSRAAGPESDPAEQETPCGVVSAIRERSEKCWGATAPTVMVGRDPSFTTVIDRVARFADSESPVLVTGETGTGKELFARALYLLSSRFGRPFFSVNCAQYHEGHLAASELFGHKKGSFTGANADHTGLFEAANEGMVFLDEVTELSLHAQAMLLRALSENEIVPVGETRARRVRVRVVAATSSDVPGLLQKGQFRPDLFYRLRGLHLQVPPVRERGRDWELIRDHYLDRLGEGRSSGKRFSAASIEILSRYRWPGNVREIKSVVETGFHLSDGEVIEPMHFMDSLEEAARVDQMRRVPICDVEGECYERMAQLQVSFWDAVHRPFMDRELSRSQVKGIVSRGLAATHGSYKKLLGLFGLAEDEYLRFMDFLRHHRLKPDGSSATL